jgi:hypothetical protein
VDAAYFFATAKGLPQIAFSPFFAIFSVKTIYNRQGLGEDFLLLEFWGRKCKIYRKSNGTFYFNGM